MGNDDTTIPVVFVFDKGALTVALSRAAISSRQRTVKSLRSATTSLSSTLMKY